MPAQKLLTVVGATGTQGGSVIAAALREGTYKIRGISRNVHSVASQALSAQGVEMVTANLNDEASIIKAFAGSHAIFAITDFFEPFSIRGPDAAINIEAQQGINLARAASRTSTLEHYIWSTLPNGKVISGGKYVVPHFEGKNRVDEWIKGEGKRAGLLEKTTFLWVTFYEKNFGYPMFTPNFIKSSGKYVQLSLAPASTPIHTIGSTSANVGHFVLAALSKPSISLPGKFVLAATETLSAGEMLRTWGEAMGKETVYVQVQSLDEFDSMWPMWGKEMGGMMAFWGEARERSWTGAKGDDIITREELGLNGTELVGLKQAFQEMDWSNLI